MTIGPLIWPDLVQSWYTSLLVVIASVLALWWVLSKTNPIGTKGLPPGSYGWPIIGETAEFIIDGKKYMKHRMEKYGPVFKTSLIGIPMIVVSGASNVAPILMGEGDTVSMTSPGSIQKLLGKHTLTMLRGERHRALHKSILRILGCGTPQKMTPMVHQVIRDYVAKWRRLGYVESCVEEYISMSLTISTKVLLPLDFDEAQMKEVVDLFNTYNSAFLTFPVNLPGFGFRKGMDARKELIRILGEGMARMLNNNDPKGNINRSAVGMEILKLCTEEGDAYANDSKISFSSSEETVRINTEQFLNIFLELTYASFQTTASTMCALTICLAQNPHVLERVRQALMDGNISTKDPKELLTYREVMSCAYVKDVMKETLRLMPPLAGAFRKTVRPIDIMGYHIPIGWTILYMITNTHDLAPKFEDRRSQFDPDRWRDKTTENNSETVRPDRPKEDKGSVAHNRFDYIPFGGGVRGCVGSRLAQLVLKIFIIEMAQTGSWSLVNGPPQMRTAPIPFPKDNLPVQFEPHLDSHVSGE